MAEDEKKCIGILHGLLATIFNYSGYTESGAFWQNQVDFKRDNPYYANAIEIVLNLIEKQQKALQDSVPKEAIRELYNKYFEDIKIYDRENKKRDSYYYECIKVCDVLEEILGE